MPYFTDDMTEDQIAKTIKGHYDFCKQGIDPIWRRIGKNHKLFMGKIDRDSWPYMSTIFVKRTMELCFVEAARTNQSIMGQLPIFQAQPVSSDDVDRSPALRHLLHWQIETMGKPAKPFRREFRKWCLMAAICGYSPMMVDYETRNKTKRVKASVRQGLGAALNAKIREKKRITDYSGARAEVLNPFSYLFNPFTDQYTSPFHFRRLLMHFDKLKEMENDGLIFNVDKLKNSGGRPIDDSQPEKDINEMMSLVSSDQWMYYDPKANIEVIESYYPQENRYFLLGNGKTVLTDPKEKIVFDNAQVPIVLLTPYMNPWHWRGLGIPEIIEDLQHELNFKRCARMDFMNRSSAPMFERLRGARIENDQVKKWKPWSFVDSDILPGLRPIEFPHNWISESINEEGLVDRDMQSQLGAYGARGGIQPESRETGYSMQQRVYASMIPFSDRLQNCCDSFEEVLNLMMAHNRQFMPESMQIRVVGSKKYVTITSDDYLTDCDFIITPSSSYGNRMFRQNDWKEFFAILASNPYLAPSFTWKRLAKQFAESWDMRDVDQLVSGASDQEVQQQGIQMGVGGTAPGGSPTAQAPMAEAVTGQ